MFIYAHTDADDLINCTLRIPISIKDIICLLRYKHTYISDLMNCTLVRANAPVPVPKFIVVLSVEYVQA